MGNRRGKKREQQAEVRDAEKQSGCQVEAFVCSEKLRFQR